MLNTPREHPTPGIAGTSGSGPTRSLSIVRFTRNAAALALLSLALVSCDDDPAAPPVPANIQAFAGDAQSAVAGTPVSVPPAVRVTDDGGGPVVGVDVRFTVRSGGGAVEGADATTNADGVATAGSWTLGTTPGENVLTARTAGLLTEVVFTATGTVAPPPPMVVVGQADGTFGNAGIVTSDFGIGQNDTGARIVAGPGGLLYMTGFVAAQAGNQAAYSMAIWSYNAFDGSVNAAFGGGRVLSTFPVTSGADRNEGIDIAVGQDGRVYVAGYSEGVGEDMTIWSYEADGTPNSAFGNGNGYIRHDNAAGGGGEDRGNAIAFGPDGNLYVAGRSENASDDDLAVWSYGTDGVLNTAFGIRTFDGGGTADQASDLVVSPDGVVYATGFSGTEMVIVSYASDGSLNTAFGGTGVVTAGYPSASSVKGAAIALGPSGKVYVTGSAFVNAARRLLVWSYNADGTPDAGFGGGDGVAEFAATGKDVGGLDLHVDGSGYVLVSGVYTDFAAFPPDAMLLVMFNSAGGIAQGEFGVDGHVIDDRGAEGRGLLLFDDEAYVTGPSRGVLQSPLSDMILWNYR